MSPSRCKVCASPGHLLGFVSLAIMPEGARSARMCLLAQGPLPCALSGSLAGSTDATTCIHGLALKLFVTGRPVPLCKLFTCALGCRDSHQQRCSSTGALPQWHHHWDSACSCRPSAGGGWRLDAVDLEQVCSCTNQSMHPQKVSLQSLHRPNSAQLMPLQAC